MGMLGTFASSSAGLFFSELVGAGVIDFTLGAGNGEVTACGAGFAAGVVFSVFANTVATPADSMATIKIASSLW